jgi:hypothetical protein
MKLGTAFELGRLPAAAGAYFHALELIARARRQCPSAAEALDAQDAAISARGRETIEQVLATERLLAEVALAAPARPQTFAGYGAWARDASLAARAAAEHDLQESSAFVLGSLVGDLELLVALRALVRTLAPIAPEVPILTEQAASLDADLARRTGHLDLAAMNPGLPDAVHGVLRELADTLRRTEHDARASTTALSRAREAIAAQLAEP